MPTIETIDIYRLRLPLISPFRTAYGSDDAVEPVLVRLGSGEHFGWGEGQAFQFPTYCPEHSAGVFLTICKVLAPTILGKQLETGEKLAEAMACFKGNPFAKGTIDMAFWDLSAKLQSKPLWQVLGGKKGTIDVGADFGVMEAIDALLAKVNEANKAGFKRIKLKYAPGWDIDMVAAVRQAFPKLVFHVDCNSGYTLKDLSMFQKLDQYNLAMIEQPLMHDDLIDHATLARQIDTPICLDESIISPEKARKAIEIGACGWINIKPIRVGGLTNALKIHDLCEQAGVPCWVGGMLESGLGELHCAAMATLSNIKYPSDVFPSSRFFKRDLVTPELTLSGPSQMTLPTKPGVGTEPDPEQLEQCVVDHAKLEI